MKPDKLNLFLLYTILIIVCSSLVCAIMSITSNADERSELYKETLVRQECVPTHTPIPTCTPIPTPTPFPTSMPLHPIEVTPEEFYHMSLFYGYIEPAYDEDDRISVYRGVYWGPSGRETYYNLRMDLCVEYMRDLGYDEDEYPYWIRDDGAKMLGNYVMCAANWSIRPKGTILETSLGSAIVVDTGDFIYEYPDGVDLAVDW